MPEKSSNANLNPMINHLQKKMTEKPKEQERGLQNARRYFWVLLQNKKLKGRKFIRKYRIGECTVDFYCPEERIALILENEDLYTSFSLESDCEKLNVLSSLDIQVLRFDIKSVSERGSEIISRITRCYAKVNGSAVKKSEIRTKEDLSMNTAV